MFATSDPDYDHELGDAAKERLNDQNWSHIFPIYTTKIDMTKGGEFDKTLKEQLSSITKDLAEEFPGTESLERLMIQYAAMLACWR